MVPKTCLAIGLVALLCLAAVPAVQAQYIGSDACFECHPTQYNDWKVSGHPYKIVSMDDALVRPIPLPSGFRPEDISYVIGGYKWKSRFMDLNGYIITTVFDEEFETPIEGMNQYNYMTDQWVDYHAGEVDKPYDCGACHTTGWIPDEDAETDGDLSDNQDGLPGIWGTWEFPGIHCEECHGPGSGHDPQVDPSAEACGACHIRGSADAIPAKGGFIRHHEQYNEFLASPHNIMDCVNCHNPHKKSEFSLILNCDDCHSSIAESYASTPMGEVGVACEDCHMPYAAKSAAALGPNRGDVRSHLFTINTSKNGEMFTPDGLWVLLDSEGQGAITLDFACMDCHPNRHVNWLAKNAKDFHFQDGAPSKQVLPPTSTKGAGATSLRSIRKSGN